MTTLQIQSLLTYLGYDPGDVDGIPGRNTRQAVLSFQAAEGLETDGSPGPLTQAALLDAVESGRFRVDDAKTIDGSTGTWWDSIRYFTREEFRCPCPCCGGFPVEPDETLVRLADRVREHFEAPANVSSGVRCQAHNDELSGSAKNSYHLRGKAMDFCVRGVSGAKLLAYVKTQQVHYAYQISGSDYVHMDVY